MIIMPKERQNIGRFINSSDNIESSNCKPSIALINTNRGYEFILYFIATKDIQPNIEEL